MRYFLLAGFISACTLGAQSEPAAGSIVGHVLNSLTSAPIRKATVILTARRIRLVADTDAEGTFQFTALPPATYRLSATHAGFLDHPARRPVSLGPNDQVTDVEIRLPPQGVITGHVLDEDGEPVDRARVLLFKLTYRHGTRRWDPFGPSSATNDAGEYRFPNLRPGRYILQASSLQPPVDNRYGSPPTKFYVPAYYPNALARKQASPVDVGVGSEAGSIDIHLSKLAQPPFFHVRGKVAGVPRDSQIEILVGLLVADDAPFGCCGNTLAKPPDYVFDLDAHPGQYTLAGNVLSGGPEAYGSEALTITGDVAGIVLNMAAAPEIAGRILLADSERQVSVQGLTVNLSELEFARAQDAQPDATGKFVFRKPFRPGRYKMYIRSIPDGFFLRNVRLGGQEISPDDFEISASAQLELVLGGTAAMIGGSVWDSDGKPFPSSTVTLIPADGTSPQWKRAVDDDGQFRFTGLRPGKYKLFAWEAVDDDLWQDPEFRKKFEDRATEITVGAKETQTAKLRAILADEMK